MASDLIAAVSNSRRAHLDVIQPTPQRAAYSEEASHRPLIRSAQYKKLPHHFDNKHENVVDYAGFPGSANIRMIKP